MVTISALSVLFIVLMQLTEIYAVFIKGLNVTVGVRQVLALANIIQYAARIMYLAALVGLTTLFEVHHLSTEILWLLLLGFTLGGLASLLLCVSGRIKRLVDLLFMPIVNFSFPDLKDIFSQPRPNQSIFVLENTKTKVFLFTAISSTLIGAAAILPFCFAIIAPEYRMLATYSGQILNFSATTLIFMLVEPHLFRHLDDSKNDAPGLCKTAEEIIFAKMVSQILLVFGISVAIFLFE